MPWGFVCRSHRCRSSTATDDSALTSSRRFCAITTVSSVRTQQPAGARLPDIHCRLGKVSPKGRAAKAPLPEAGLAELIQWIRGEKVILDRDLARLYQVEVKVLNQAVKRNSSRFPGDFMFQLTAVEAGSLRSQSVTLDGVEAAASSAQARGKHLKYRPYAFTEQGVVGKAA